MGQRLVLSIKNNGEEVLNIYYHYSAYTLSSVQEMINICEPLSSAGIFDWKKNELSEDDVLEIVKSIAFRKGEHPIVVRDDLKYLDKIDVSTFTSRIQDNHPDSVKALSKCKSMSELFRAASEAVWQPSGFDNDKYKEIDAVLPELFGDRSDGLIAISQESRDYNESWSEGFASIDIYTEECWTNIFWMENIDIIEETDKSITYTVPCYDDEEYTCDKPIDNFPEFVTVNDLEWYGHFMKKHDGKLVHDAGEVRHFRILE